MVLWELVGHFARDQRSCLQGSDVRLLNKVPNHNQWLTGWLQHFSKPIRPHASRSLNVRKDSQERCKSAPKDQDRTIPTITHNLTGPAPSPVVGHHLSAPHQTRQPMLKYNRSHESSISSVQSAETHDKPPVLNFGPAMGRLPEFWTCSLI